MPKITYLPFSRDADGDFLAGAAIDVRSAEEARASAARMGVPDRGAVAFSKSGNPQLGEWEDAVILGRYVMTRMISRRIGLIERDEMRAHEPRRFQPPRSCSSAHSRARAITAASRQRSPVMILGNNLCLCLRQGIAYVTSPTIGI